jgi:hypothetical protein
MAIRRVPALLLIILLLAIPLCALGCAPGQLTGASNGATIEEFSCHEPSEAAAPDKNIPDNSPKPTPPCTHCAHLLNAIKHSDSSLFLSPALSDFYKLSQTSVAVPQPLEHTQRCHPVCSSPPRFTVLRI